MKKNLVLLVPSGMFIGILIIIILCFYLCCNFLKKEVIKTDQIINEFRNYENDFNDVIEELFDEESISFVKTKGSISITIYSHDENNYNKIIKVKDENISKYLKSISLINKLNLESIYKTNHKIFFCFNSEIGFGQYIAYVSNMSDIYYYYKTDKTEYIKDNWYYFDTKR